MINSADLTWGPSGLIPAVVQDASTGQVLMVAYMNAEALALTQRTGEAHFWSRSRQELWHKGATSGNTQRVVTISADCDRDTLLVQVDPAGPACHTGEVSCFFNPVGESDAAAPTNVDWLYELVTQRKQSPTPGSYTNRLFDAGLNEIAKKVGEEGVEVVVAALGQDTERATSELADLVYHALVLMAEIGVTPDDIRGELQKRHTPRQTAD